MFHNRLAVFCIPFVFTTSLALGAEDRPQPVGPHGDGAASGKTYVVAPAPRVAVKWKIRDEEKAQAVAFWEAIADKHPEFAGRKKTFDELAKMTEVNLREAGPHSLEKALYLLSLTPNGRQLLRGLVPKWLKGTVTFGEIGSKEAKEIEPMERAVSFYLHGKIFWDPRMDLLRQLPALMHEGQNAVDLAGTPQDEKLHDYYLKNRAYNAKWAQASEANLASRNAKDKKTHDEKLEEAKALVAELKTLKGPLDALRPTRDAIRVSTESSAYRMQNWLITDVEKSAPTYREALKEHVARGEWIAEPVDEQVFRRIMKHPVHAIPDNTVDMYLRMYPWPK